VSLNLSWIGLEASGRDKPDGKVRLPGRSPQNSSYSCGYADRAQ